MKLSNYKNYFQEILKELRLTTFPTQNIVITFTLFVILFTAAMAIYLGALDLGFGKGMIYILETLKLKFGGLSNIDIKPVFDIATSTATTTLENLATSTNIILK